MLPLLFSFSIHAQWHNQVSGVPENLYGVAFANKDTGIVAGGSLYNSVILQTFDGGLHWNPTYMNDSKWLYDAVYTGNGVFFACGHSGIIYKSTNFGTTWSPKPSNTSEWLYSIFFLTPDTGYCAGQNGVILRTTNAGNNWDPISYQAPITLLSIYFYDALHGITCGMGGRIFRTTDGGSNWEEVENEENKTLTSIHMLTLDSILACGMGGMIEFSPDSGLSWQTIVSTTPFDLNDMIFADRNTGFIAGDGVLMKTTDAGMSWTHMNYPVTSDLFGVYVVDFGTAYAVGSLGTIIKNDLSISVEEHSKFHCQIFPNPVSDKLIIQTDESGDFILSIHNMNGQIVLLDEQSNVSSFEVCVSAWPPGMYMGILTGTEFSKPFRFVVH